MVGPEDEVFAITSAGGVIRTSAVEIKQSGRQTMGVRLMNLAEGDSGGPPARNAESVGDCRSGGRPRTGQETSNDQLGQDEEHRGGQETRVYLGRLVVDARRGVRPDRRRRQHGRDPQGRQAPRPRRDPSPGSARPRGPRRDRLQAPGQPPKKETPRAPQSARETPKDDGKADDSTLRIRPSGGDNKPWSRPQSPNGDQARDEPTAAFKAPRLPTPVSAPEPIVTASRPPVEQVASERAGPDDVRAEGLLRAGAAQGPPGAAARRAVVGHEVQLRGVAGVLRRAVRGRGGALRGAVGHGGVRRVRPGRQPAAPRAKAGPRPRSTSPPGSSRCGSSGTRPCWGL